MNTINTALAVRAPLLACAAVFACIAAFAEKQPYERYKSIVDRQMFGTPPPGFDPEKMPSEVSRSEQKQLTKEQEKLQSSIHFSVINITPDGDTAVGFTDNTNPKEPVHYYLKVGEKRNGWEVKEASADTATMTIARGDIEVSLTIGENSGKGGGNTTARGGGAADAESGASPRRLTQGGLLGNMRGGMLSRRRQEREMLRQKEEMARKEQEDKLREDREAAEQAAEQARQDREAQRQQLMAIKDELLKMRNDKENKPARQDSSDEGNE